MYKQQYPGSQILCQFHVQWNVYSCQYYIDRAPVWSMCLTCMNKNQSLDQYDSISDVGKFYEIILNLSTSTLRPQLRIHANEPSGSRDGQ